MINVINHPITIDLANKMNMIPNYQIKKNDNNSHKFVFTILNNSLAYDLTGQTAKIYFQKSDTNKVFDDCSLDDAVNGKLSSLLSTQCLSYAGVVATEITIYGTNGEILTSITFNFTVVNTIRDDVAIQSSSEFTALTNALVTVNNIVSEVQTARGTYPNLDARLDNTDTQLADIPFQIYITEKAKQGSVDAQRYMYGYFQKPSDFKPLLPCNFFRDSNGIMQHDMDFSQYTNGTVLYVNFDTGNDSTGTGASETPYKTIYKALCVARDGADTSYCIHVKNDTRFMRDESIPPIQVVFTNKTIAIIPDNVSNKIIMTGGQRGLSWSADGTGTWKTTRSAVKAVYDMRVVDSNGLQIPLVAKNSLSDCQATINTWYTDGTSLWVHTSDGLIPTDENIDVGLSEIAIAILLGTSKLYIKNCTFLSASANDGVSIRGDLSGATVVGEFVADTCNFVGSSQTYNIPNDLGNAVAIAQCKKAYFFNCKSAYAKRDGFNFHYDKIPTINRRDCLALLFNCESYNQGLISDTVSNNAFTCHDGTNILLIRCNGYNTKGPVFADVNGCYSIGVDCNMRDSVSNDSVYYFDNNTPPDGVTGKAILINCTHNGETLTSSDLYIDSTIQAMLYYTNLPNLKVGSSIPTIMV